MKKLLTVSLAALLIMSLGVSALADGESALTAFYALTAASTPTPDGYKSGQDRLAEIMAGAYAVDTKDAFAEQALANQLADLSSITFQDITAYASANKLSVTQVRNAYYRTLANSLKADIQLNPSSEETRHNAQLIFSLFLEDGTDVNAVSSRETIRQAMSREYGQTLASQYNLPASFVEFLIMNDDWDDDDWDNDDDWRDRVAWGNQADNNFSDISIGSKDNSVSNRIADLQDMLIDLGYLNGKADGIFGPRTQSALIEFQMANGLDGTGVYNARSSSQLQDNSTVVARWDYNSDFWDSRDYDTPYYPSQRVSGQTGTNQSTSRQTTSGTTSSGTTSSGTASSGTTTSGTTTRRYDTPAKYDTPVQYDTPVKYDTPNTPDRYNTPDTPNRYDTPNTPDSYDSP